MGERAAKPICETLGDRRSMVRQLAVERSNPAGVVDLRLLHNLGERIQADDRLLAEHRAEYVAIMHKPFDESSCPK